MPSSSAIEMLVKFRFDMSDAEGSMRQLTELAKRAVAEIKPPADASPAEAKRYGEDVARIRQTIVGSFKDLGLPENVRTRLTGSVTKALKEGIRNGLAGTPQQVEPALMAFTAANRRAGRPGAKSQAITEDELATTAAAEVAKKRLEGLQKQAKEQEAIAALDAELREEGKDSVTLQAEINAAKKKRVADEKQATAELTREFDVNARLAREREATLRNQMYLSSRTPEDTYDEAEVAFKSIVESLKKRALIATMGLAGEEDYVKWAAETAVLEKELKQAVQAQIRTYHEGAKGLPSARAEADEADFRRTQAQQQRLLLASRALGREPSDEALLKRGVELEASTILVEEEKKQALEAQVRQLRGADLGGARADAAKINDERVRALQRQLVATQEAMGLQVTDAELLEGIVQLDAQNKVAKEQYNRRVATQVRLATTGDTGAVREDAENLAARQLRAMQERLIVLDRAVGHETTEAELAGDRVQLGARIKVREEQIDRAQAAQVRNLRGGDLAVARDDAAEANVQRRRALGRQLVATNEAMGLQVTDAEILQDIVQLDAQTRVAKERYNREVATQMRVATAADTGAVREDAENLAARQLRTQQERLVVLNRTLGRETSEAELAGSRVEVAARIRIAEEQRARAEAAAVREAKGGDIAAARDEAAEANAKQIRTLQQRVLVNDEILGMETQEATLVAGRLELAARVKVGDEKIAAATEVRARELRAADPGLVRADAAKTAAREVETLQRRLIVANEALGLETEAAALSGGRVKLASQVNIAEERLRAAIAEETREAKGIVQPKTGLFQRVYGAVTHQEPSQVQSLGRFLGTRALSTAAYSASAAFLYGGVETIKEMTSAAEELEVVIGRVKIQFQNLGKGDEFAGFRDSMLQIARDTGAASTDVFKVAAQLQGAFGGDVPRTIRETTAAFEAARVTGLDIHEVVDAFTSLTENFEKTGVTIEGVADKALGLEQRFGVLAKETISFSADLAPVAEGLGFTVQQLEALGAVAQKYTARSGASLAEAFGRILPAIQDKQVDIIDVFTGFPELKQEVDQLNLAFGRGDIQEVFTVMAQSYKKLSEPMQKHLLSLVGQRRETAALMPVFQHADELLKEWNRTQSDSGKLAEQNAKLQESLLGRVKRLGESLRQLGNTLYEAGLSAPLKDAVSVLGEMIDLVQELGHDVAAINDAFFGWPGHLAQVVILMGAIATASAAASKAAEFAAGTRVGAKVAEKIGFKDYADTVAAKKDDAIGVGTERGLTKARQETVAANEIAIGSEEALAKLRSGETIAAGGLATDGEAALAQQRAVGTVAADEAAMGGEEALAQQRAVGTVAATEAAIGVEGALAEARSAGAAASAASGVSDVAKNVENLGKASGGAALITGRLGTVISRFGGLAASAIVIAGAQWAHGETQAGRAGLKKNIDDYRVEGRLGDASINDLLERSGVTKNTGIDKSSYDKMLEKLKEQGSLLLEDTKGFFYEVKTQQDLDKYIIELNRQHNSYVQQKIDEFGNGLPYVQDIFGSSAIENGAEAIKALSKENRDRQIDILDKLLQDTGTLEAFAEYEAEKKGTDPGEEAQSIQSQLETAKAKLASNTATAEDLKLLDDLFTLVNKDIQPALDAAAQKQYAEQKDALDAANARSDYAAGRISYSEMIDTLKTELEKAKTAYAANPTAEGLERIHQLEDDNYLAETDGMKRRAEFFIQAAERQGGNVGAVKVEQYLNLLKSGKLRPDDEKEYAQKVIDALKEERAFRASVAGSAEEAARIMAEEIAIPPEVQAVLLEEYISVGDEKLAEFLKNMSAVAGVTVDSMVNQLVNLMLTGKTLSEAIATMMAEGKQKAIEAFDKAYPGWRQALDNMTPEQRAEFGKSPWAKPIVDAYNALSQWDTAPPPVTEPSGTTTVSGDSGTKTDKAAEGQKLQEARWALAEADAKGDAIALARIAQERARFAQSMAATDAEKLQALAQLHQADQQMNDALQQQTEGWQSYWEAVFGDDPVLKAQNAVANALKAFNEAGETDKGRLWGELVRAQQNLEKALLDRADIVSGLEQAKLRYRGDDLGALKLQLADLKRRRDDAKAGGNIDTYNQISAQIVDLEGQIRDTDLSDQRALMDFRLQMGQISKGQAIAWMQTLLQNKELTDDQERDLQLAIKNMQNELGSDAQFNLPSRLKLPTLYEVRRLTQTGAKGMAGYQDNRVISVTIHAQTNASAQDIAKEVGKVVGQPNRTGLAPRAY